MNPIIEQAAADYAGELGRSDYPALERCPYDPLRSVRLHAAYWRGWRSGCLDAAAAGERKTAA